MDIPATNSSLDVAYWFLKRAEVDSVYLETEKLQHLLFVAQNKYAQTHYRAMLMPCLFLCDDKGFFEPTLKKLFAQGRPSISSVHLNNSLTAFLEQIWQELSPLSLSQCKQLITSLPIYSLCYKKGITSVVSWEKLSSQYGIQQNDISKPFHKKILVSQNGPVIVSQWTPKKVNKQERIFIHE